MLGNDFPEIRRLLRTLIVDAMGKGVSINDADDLIAALFRHYPNGIPANETVLRSEISALAGKNNLAVAGFD